MSIFGAKIVGFGRGLPEQVVTNFDLERLFDTTDDWITQRTGIKQRYIVDPDKGENATSLGAKAVENAIKQANENGSDIKAEDLDMIICATATGDNLFPATSCLIQHAIGNDKAMAMDLAAACTGYIYALNTAYNFIKTGQCKNAVVIGVDLMSKFIDWEDRRTAVLFGDGAGATIITATKAEDDQFNPFYLRARGDAECRLIVPNVASKYPVAAKDITDKPVMVHMDGPAVYQFAVKAVPEALAEACKCAGIEPSEIDFVVPHQANVRILEGASKRLKIPMEKFITNIDRYGNTSAASIPIAFDEAVELGHIPSPDPNNKLKIAMVGFGAGLTWGATIIDY